MTEDGTIFIHGTYILFFVVFQFTGYDVGNQLIQVSGITTTLFPSDGGQIRTERTDFIQGNITKIMYGSYPVYL